MESPPSSFFTRLTLITLLFVMSSAQDFDFFYFVQSWPGSYCDTKRSCCYPKYGKPAADFGIHGLWPNYNNGSYPDFCDPDTPFDPSIIGNLTAAMQEDWPSLACPSSDGLKFWKHEWEKHGTCSQSVLNQYQYFEATLSLKNKVPLLQILGDAGIEPDGGFYSLSSISEAVREATGFTPRIQCNKDEAGNQQLYEVFLCVDASGRELIECPMPPRSRCKARIEFPPFGGGDVDLSA